MERDIIEGYDFFKLSLKIKDIILNELSKFSSGTLQILDKNLKGKHKADEQVYSSLSKFFNTQNLPADIYIESGEPILCDKRAAFCIFIDPIDGSINRDLNVGDPGIIIAYASGSSPRFKDVFEGFVYGLRSKDVYYSKAGKSFYQSNNSSSPIEIHCDNKVISLEDAILYYNDGYGKEFAKQAFHKAGILPFLTKHNNAFDNAGIEICQICRGAAHIRVEARAYQINGKMIGSDHANMLAAFAIGKGSGMLVTDLEGNSLENVKIEIDHAQNFICSSNEKLLQEVLEALKKNQELLRNLIK